MTEQIPLYDVNKIIGEEVLSDIKDVINSGWLTLGTQTERFEKEFADFTSSSHGVAMNSCTSAMYAGLRVLGINAESTVAVPAMTFSATANVVRLLGAEVILVDVGHDGNMDPSSLERVLEQHPIDAVIPVHLYGQTAKMDRIMSLAAHHEFAVIEDCAHAPGATFDGKPVGSFGDVGCFSFYATKNMTTGEGGMAITDETRVAEHLRKLRNHHQTKSPVQKQQTWGYDVDGVGFNFRMSEIEATIGRRQLKHLPAMNDSRRNVANRYLEAIREISGIQWIGDPAKVSDHVFHLFVIEVGDDFPISRNELYEHLADENILTGVHYPAISQLTSYENVNGEFKCAEALSKRILSLPMFPFMDHSIQDQVIEALRL